MEQRGGGEEGEAAARALEILHAPRDSPFDSRLLPPPPPPLRPSDISSSTRNFSWQISSNGYLQRRPYCSPSFRHVLLLRAGASRSAAPPCQAGFLIFHLVIPCLVRVTPPGATSFNKAAADVATADARYAVKSFKPEFIYATVLLRAARAHAGASYLVSPSLDLSPFLSVINCRDSVRVSA